MEWALDKVRRLEEDKEKAKQTALEIWDSLEEEDKEKAKQKAIKIIIRLREERRKEKKGIRFSVAEEEKGKGRKLNTM